MCVQVRLLERRAFVLGTGSIVVSGLLGGCSATERNQEELQSGSLVVENQHVISHDITVRVSDGPEDNLGNPITFTGTVAIEPGESRRYPDWLTDGSSIGVTSGTYRIQIQLDGEKREEFTFDPAPDGDEPAYVRIVVTEQGFLEWSVIVLN